MFRVLNEELLACGLHLFRTAELGQIYLINDGYKHRIIKGYDF
jgi:hypothetical protein